MTEAEWLACADPQPMLEFLRGKASDRKLRLFAVACCRVLWDELPIEAARAAIETNECFADLRVTESELSRARSAAHNAAWQARHELKCEPLTPDGKVVTQRIVERADVPGEYLRRLYFVAFMANMPSRLRADEMPMLRTDPLLARVSPSLFRDIFGNPFRPVAIAPAWLTWNNGTVPAIARRIYEERCFEDMPILADALEDAGCADPDILTHCRQPSDHVRGCWVVDLLTGKE
jgi:hypothetical protein